MAPRLALRSPAHRGCAHRGPASAISQLRLEPGSLLPHVCLGRGACCPASCSAGASVGRSLAGLGPGLGHAERGRAEGQAAGILDQGLEAICGTCSGKTDLGKGLGRGCMEAGSDGGAHCVRKCFMDACRGQQQTVAPGMHRESHSSSSETSFRQHEGQRMGMIQGSGAHLTALMETRSRDAQAAAQSWGMPAGWPGLSQKLKLVARAQPAHVQHSRPTDPCQGHLV